MPAIYIITNTVNKKTYIGQTIGCPIKRFKKHLAQINCKNVCSALYAAFNKYGKENFSINVLIDGDYNKGELNELEVFYIKKYSSLSPGGYNLQSGGNSFVVADSVKKAISDKLKGRKVDWQHKVSAGVKKLWLNKEYRERQVLQRRNKRGKYNKHTKPLRLKLDIEKIKEMHKNGISTYKIAKEFDCSFGAIKKRLQNGN